MSIEEPYGPYNEDNPEEEIAEAAHTWVNDIPFRTYWDDKKQDWVCICRTFIHTGKCGHVYRHKPERTINVKDDLLLTPTRGDNPGQSMTEAKIRTRNSKEIARQRRPQRHKCWDHLICAPLWPMHGVNLGTLLRTCEAAGACMTVPHYPWIPEALNKGYTIRQRGCVHWVRPNALTWLQRQHDRDDTQVIAVELADEAIRVADLHPAKQRTIMVLGHEKTGIPPEALEYIDVAVEIPMLGAGSTLNVAVAGSMVLYRLAGLL